MNGDDNNELPEGWASATVGDVSQTIQYGHTASAVRDQKGPRFLRITDIQDGKVNWDQVPTCELDSGDLAKYQLQAGDIVFARTGATTGKSFLIRECPPAIFASYLIRLRPTAAVESGFLSLFFQTSAYWKLISENVSGNAQPNCNASKLGALPMPIPPLAEQRRIVAAVEAVLAKVNVARERLNRVPAILKRFQQAALSAACSGRLSADWRDEHDVSDEWTSVRLREVGAVTGGITKNARRASLPKQVPYLRVANVYENHLELAEVLDIGVTDEEFHRTELRRGDLLFVEGNGSVDQIGRVAMWDGSIAGCVHQNHLIRFRSSNQVLPEYALIWAMAPQGREQLIEQAVSSAGLHSLSISKVGEVEFELATFAEQQEIVRRVSGLFALADRIEDRLTDAQRMADQLTQAVLAKAFRGELVPTEAELARREKRSYEPASELVARIRGDRDAALAKGNGKKRSSRRRTPN